MTTLVALGGNALVGESERGTTEELHARLRAACAALAALAERLEASRLVIPTGVPAIYRDFGAPGQEELRVLSTTEAEALLAGLAEGSMRPKLAATLADALAGRAGTRITAR